MPSPEMFHFQDDTDLPLMRWLRLALMGLLGVAVIATLMSLVLGASRYLRMPDGVVHAKKAPRPKAVSPDDFFGSLKAADGKAHGPAAVAAAKGESGAEAATGESGKTAAAGESVPVADGDAPRFAPEVQDMMKCAHDFATGIGRTGPEPDAAAMEDFRVQLVRVADASPDRGAAWTADVARFVCAALDEKDAGELAKAGKLDQPLVAAVNFHIAQWDAARQRLHEFEAQEKKRVETESIAAARRLDEARNAVSSAMSAAGVSFGLVLALCACLLLAMVESHLRGIRANLEDLALPDFSQAAVPVVSEEVPMPAAAVTPGSPAGATVSTSSALAMDDPLEVEYQIPEEAISRS